MGSRPPATRYPHPAPPQPVCNPQAALFRRLLSILLATIVTLSTIVFITWLLLRPRLPYFRVHSLSISNFNLSSASRLTGKWDVKLTVYNPNGKFRLYYDDVEAGVYYRDETLTQTDLAPFVQGKKDLTALRASFAVAGDHVERWVAEGIRRGREDGRVDFNVRLGANVRFKLGFWRARERWVRVYCGDMGVGMTAAGRNGSLVRGGARGCRVGL